MEVRKPRRLPMRTWTSIVVVLWTLSTCRAGGDESRRSDAYFPLTPGSTWKYAVSIKAGDAEPKLSQQSVTVESKEFGGKVYAIASENAYATKDDGVYIVAVVRNGKLETLEEPQKVVPAIPRVGEQWTYREAAGVTTVTCLGNEKVHVGAGEYDAAKLYLVTVGGTDQADRKEVYRWFAPGVGPVKGSVTQQRRNPDGTFAPIDMTMELAAYTPPVETKSDRPAAATTSKGTDTPDSLFAQAQTAARAGDHKTALARYDAALALDPNAAKFHAYKTLSLIATRQFDAAESEINRALAIDAKDYTFQEIAGQLKIAQGKLAEGKSLYDKAAALSPTSAGAIYTDLAAALAARNDDKLASEIDRALKMAAQSNPPSPQALFALGQSYVNAGRAEGRQYLQRYVEVASALPPDQRDDRQIRLAKQLIRAIDAVKGN